MSASSTTPTSHTAIGVASFVNSIGVNTVLGATDTSYGNLTQVEYALAYLGVTNVRDSYQGQDSAARFQQLAAQLGVSFDFFIAPGYSSAAAQVAAIEANPGIVRFVEGPNESDLTSQTYDGMTGMAATQAEQTDLYAAIHGDAALNGGGKVTPVIAPSFAMATSFAAAGNMSTESDYGNAHEYLGNGDQPGPYIGYFLNLSGQVSSGQPVIATEAGYYTMPSAAGVDAVVQAKYTLDFLFDNWMSGITMTYLYQLLDPSADPGNTNPLLHYGLFDSTGAPKPAATAVHDLIALLNNQGSGTAGSTLDYGLTGMPSATGHDLLMSTANGGFVVALWNDVPLWNAATASEISNASVPVTLTLGQTYQSVTIYDPLTGTAPIASYSNVQTISLQLPDHPILVEIDTAPARQLSLTQPTMTQMDQTGQSLSGLWSLVMANVQDTNAAYTPVLTISAVDTTGTMGSVTLNAAANTLAYTAPAYNPFDTMDSFAYTVSDGHGGTATGTIDVAVAPPPNTTYGMTPSGVYNAPSANWSLYSEASGQTLIGSSAGGDTFVGTGDTVIAAYGSGNTISASMGDHTIVTGSGAANVTLADGNQTIIGGGAGNTFVAGNGNTLVIGTTGTTSVTLGNGNQLIQLAGAGNTISVGTGTSQISAGSDGGESVTVGGGSNQIVVGGTNDLVHVLGGTASIWSATGQSTIHLDAGTSTLIAEGTGNTVTTGSGSDTILLVGAGNTITAGSGSDTISFIQSGNTVAVGSGAMTIYDSGGGNTIVLAAAGGQTTQAYGNFATNGDILDLRMLLASTAWNGNASSVSNFLSVSASGLDAILSVNPTGVANGATQAVVDLHLVGQVSLSTLLAHSIV